MSRTPSISRRRHAASALAACSVALGGLLAAGTPAQAQTSAQPINTVVLHLTGQMNFTFDKTFLKTVKKAKATLSVKNGATYVSKTRTATLPIDTTSTITASPASADIAATGTVMIRRKDGRKIVAQDIGLRLRDSGVDLSGTVRGRPGREFAGLTASATISVQQTDAGYAFVDVQMLVSPDIAKAAKKAHIKGIVAGAPLGLMTSQFTANLPSFNLPGLGNLIPGLGA
jgi:hypothetical protein